MKNESSDENRKRKQSTAEISQTPNKKIRSNNEFELGNYNRYYGYRNIDECTDSRVDNFMNRPELFLNKDILDIGCNIGHITYVIARDLSPNTVLGIDIDNSLIRIARKNLHHYLNKKQTNYATDSETTAAISEVNKSIGFPDNISFIHSNYVLDHDSLLDLEESRYDVILCLSVTKWVHLNWGDDGLKRVFKRIFLQLRSGGVFILEAQQWDSYKKKKLGTKLRKKCREIKFYPKMFHDYLLSEIGFCRAETLAVPAHTSKGFQRPIELYFKK